MRIEMIDKKGKFRHVETVWKGPRDEENPMGNESWTGKTWFRLKELDFSSVPRREEASPPDRRVRQKTQHRVPDLEEHTPTQLGDEPENQENAKQPEEATIFEPDRSVLPPEQVPLPDDASMGLSESIRGDLKRPVSEASEVRWESLPPNKKSRLELLEVLHTQLLNKNQPKPTKNRECQLSQFQGKDLERFRQAIHKEINNNLGTEAYEILSEAELEHIRTHKPDKIMKSRYVFTMKPIEDFALDDARSADLVLDASTDGPSKAKCRHVMQGFSEPDLLQLETSTPQVHRDSVIFTAQILVPKKWTPGFADFTQAFHSGDAINRELYALQPREGIPGASAKQLIKLKKTCYGLTDGPSAWPHQDIGLSTVHHRSVPLLPGQ